MTVPAEPPFLSRRRAVLESAPPITAVVCTRNRPAQLTACLDSLLAQAYPRFRVLVVDNAPDDDATARVVRAAAERGPVDYLAAPVPGLSNARNVAVAATPGEILAWLDDDTVADRHWLAEVARALDEHPMADVVCGTVVPAELETQAQLWFERFGGHSKGRGFTPAVFTLLDDGLAYVKEDDKVLNDPGGAEGMATVPSDLEDAVVEAAEECPGECIFVEKA